MFKYRVIPLIFAWSSPVLAGHPSNNANHTQYRQLTQVQPVYERVGINAPAEQYWLETILTTAVVLCPFWRHHWRRTRQRV
jgi:hypothetical protein